MSNLTTTPNTTLAEQPNVFKRAWEGWKKFAHKLGVFNTRVIMSVLYFVIILPAGLIFRMVSDPLQLAEPPESNWVPLPPDEHDMDAAHNQF